MGLEEWPTERRGEGGSSEAPGWKADVLLCKPARFKQQSCGQTFHHSETDGLGVPGGALVGEIFGIPGICLLFSGCSRESSPACEPSSESARTRSRALGKDLEVLRRR